MIIRPMKKTDTDEVIRLHKEIIKSPGSTIGNVYLEHLYHILVTQKERECYVAVENNHIAGFVAATNDLQKTNTQLSLLCQPRILWSVVWKILTGKLNIFETYEHTLFQQRIANRVSSGFYILALVTSPQHQRQGVAKKLIEKLADDAKQTNHPSLWVDTYADNVPANTFYHHVGFQPYKTYGKNVLYRKKLS